MNNKFSNISNSGKTESLDSKAESKIQLTSHQSSHQGTLSGSKEIAAASDTENFSQECGELLVC